MDVSKRTFLHASTPTFPQNSIGRRTEQEVVCLSVGAMFGTLCSRILCAVPISAALGAPGSHQGSRETVQSLQSFAYLSRAVALVSFADTLDAPVASYWCRVGAGSGTLDGRLRLALRAFCARLHSAERSGALVLRSAARLVPTQGPGHHATWERGVEHWKVSIGWM